MMANKTKIEKLEDLIRDSIGGELVEQTASSLLPPGENYGSVIYKVDFKVKKDGKEQEYHAVAKCTPPSHLTQELFNTQDTFKSEIAWYTTVIPTLKQFQKDHGVEKQIDFFHQLYGARISLDPSSDRVDLDGVMLTENLKYLGYHNIDRHVGFDLPTTHSILKDLATFHAVPLAIKTQNPELFNKKIGPYLPQFADVDCALQKGLTKQIYTVFDQIPECQVYMERIKKSVDNAIFYGARSLREPWVTVIHMDFYMNNIMVTGGNSPKTVILDLQFPCMGTPAADLAFFLLTSVNLTALGEKYDDLVKFYFEQFSENLRELKVSPDKYTFDGLLQEIETEMRNGEFGHALGHIISMLGDKGKTFFNSSEEDSKKGTLAVQIVVPNERLLQKFKWVALEGVKRNWI